MGEERNEEKLRLSGLGGGIPEDRSVCDILGFAARRSVRVQALAM